MYMCIYVYMYICTYVYVYLSLSLSIYIYIYILHSRALLHTLALFCWGRNLNVFCGLLGTSTTTTTATTTTATTNNNDTTLLTATTTTTSTTKTWHAEWRVARVAPRSSARANRLEERRCDTEGNTGDRSVGRASDMICVYIYICTELISLSLYMYISIYTYIYIYACIGVCVCIYIYIYVSLSLNMCIYIYIHTYIHTVGWCRHQRALWGTRLVAPRLDTPRHPIRPVSLLTLSLLRLLDSSFPGSPLWTWEFHPSTLRLCLNQTLCNPQC